MSGLSRNTTGRPATVTDAPGPATLPLNTRGNTHRIKGIPRSWDKEKVQSFLENKFPKTTATVRSLAPELSSGTSTATVCFEHLLSDLDPFSVEADGDSRPRFLTLDTDFLGITSLFCPSEEDHAVDIVAISGLGGHAFGSFKEKDEDYMWLRDALPHDLLDEDGKCFARIMTYGYDSELANSQSSQVLRDLGLTLRGDMRSLVSGSANRPVIFIAHSLGGLVLKEICYNALSLLSKSRHEVDRDLMSIIHGIMFFGVPHGGMDIKYLIPMVGNNPNRSLLQGLEQVNSSLLGDLNECFQGIIRGQPQIEVFCFYETLTTPTAIQNETTGDWERKGPPAFLVTKESAILSLPSADRNEKIFPMNRDHSNLIKFGPNELDYSRVLQWLSAMPGIKRATEGAIDNIACARIEATHGCLDSLSFEDLGARQHDVAKAVTGTCDWLFETPEFLEWCHRDNLASHRGVLWLKGKPGSGKSTLMKHAFRYCEEHFAHHRIAAYFFNARGSPLEKSPLGMLRAITYQLVKADESILDLLMDLYLKKKQQLYDNSLSEEAGAHPRGETRQLVWSSSELRDFLFRVIDRQRVHDQGSSRPPLLLLIDALDECSDDGAREVVEILEKLSIEALESKVTLRICLSNRYYPNIDMRRRQSLEVDRAEGHEQDIAAYVDERLLGTNPALTAKVLRKAEGVFLWVVLVVAQLNDASLNGQVKQMLAALSEIPGNIEEIFESLVNQSRDKHETLLALKWVLLSKRPLRLDELYLGITGPDYESWTQNRDIHTGEIMQLRITTASSGLIELRNDEINGRPQVQFIHLCVKDFLFRLGRLGKLDPSLGNDPVRASHEELWNISWQYLRHCMEPKRKDGITRLLKHSKDKQTTEQLQHDYPFLEYAAFHVLDHADEAAMPIEPAIRDVEDRSNVAEPEPPGQILAWLKAHETWLPWRMRLVRGVYWRSLSEYSDMNTDLVHTLALLGKGRLLKIVLAKPELRGQVNVNVEVSDEDLRTPLIAAAYWGNTEIVQQLLEAGAELNLRVHGSQSEFRTALIAAAFSGSTEVVQQLIEAGAQVDLQADHPRFGTALIAAAGEGNTEIVQQLLKAGAEVNLRVHGSQSGFGTALIAAAFSGSTEVVQQLLEAGAQVDLQDDQPGDFGTALVAAAGRGNTEIMQQLLEAGAKVDLERALDAADPRSDIAQLLRKAVAKQVAGESSEARSWSGQETSRETEPETSRETVSWRRKLFKRLGGGH